MDPRALLAAARRQLEPYGVECLDGFVSEATKSDGAFELLAGKRLVRSRRVLIATGVRDALPEIDGLSALWSRSVFTCPYCDGWEMRDRALATYGTTRSGVDLARELYQWSRNLVVCSDLSTPVPPGDRDWIANSGVRVKTSPIRRLIATNGALRAIEFEDGETIERDALFLSVPLQQCCDIAERLGCAMTARGHIDVDNECRTSLPGAYAAGDAVDHLHQVVFAAASGARAAIALNNDLMGTV